MPQISISTETSIQRLLGWLAFGLAISWVAGIAVWIVSGNPKPGWFTDSISYLLMADFYSGHLHNHDSFLGTTFYQTSRFPPLFPLTLALSGAGLDNWSRAYFVALGFGAAATFTTFFWLRHETRSHLAAALLLPLAIVTPHFLIVHLEILSESQFLFLLTVVFLLAARAEEKGASWWMVVAVAALVPFSRSAGGALVAAVSLWVFLKSSLSRTARALAVVVAWLPMLLWMAYRRLYPVSLDYTSILANTATRSIQDVLHFLSAGLSQLLNGYASAFFFHASPTSTRLTLALLFLGGFGLLRRLIAGRLDAFFMIFYLPLVGAWPFPHETTRLLLVTMPVMALCLWSTLEWLIARTLGSRLWQADAVAPIIALLIAVGCSGPTWRDFSRRMSAPLPSEFSPAMRTFSYFNVPSETSAHVAEVFTKLSFLMDSLADVVPKNECVWTSYFDTTAFRTSFKVGLSALPLSIHSRSDALTLLRDCRYLMVADVYVPQFGVAPWYPMNYVSGAKPVLVLESEGSGSKRPVAALLDLAPIIDDQHQHSPLQH